MEGRTIIIKHLYIQFKNFDILLKIQCLIFIRILNLIFLLIIQILLFIFNYIDLFESREKIANINKLD